MPGTARSQPAKTKKVTNFKKKKKKSVKLVLGRRNWELARQAGQAGKDWTVTGKRRAERATERAGNTGIRFVSADATHDDPARK